MSKRVKLNYKNVNLGISYDLKVGGEDSIVFIHGLGACMDSFKDVWDFPGYQKYTILTFDLPGFGGSDKPKDFSYSMEDYSAISNLLVKELNINRIHIIGHSMGGAIGLLLCRRIKSIVKSFVCLEGNLISQDCGGSREAVSYSLEDFQREGFDHLKSEISKIKDDNSLELYLDCLSKSDSYAFYKSSESLVKWSDSGKLLHIFLELEVPRFYIFGDKNENSPTVKLLSSIPKLKISNAGHAMMNDNPIEFYQKLLKIL